MISAKSAPGSPQPPTTEPKPPHLQKRCTLKPFLSSSSASCQALLYAFSGAVPHPRWAAPAWGWDASQVGSMSVRWLMVHEEITQGNELQLSLSLFCSSGWFLVIYICFMLCMLYCWRKIFSTSILVPTLWWGLASKKFASRWQLSVEMVILALLGCQANIKLLLSLESGCSKLASAFKSYTAALPSTLIFKF